MISASVIVLAMSSLLAAASPAASCEVLSPALVRDLPETYAGAHAIAVLSPQTFLIGSRTGIDSFDVKRGVSVPLVAGSDLAAVQKVRTDGKTVVAFNNSERRTIVYDLNEQKIVSQVQSIKLLVSDVAVSGGQKVVLGYPFGLNTKDVSAIWVGPLKATWSEMKPMHPLDESEAAILRFAFAPYGGALAIDDSGIIHAITPAQSGVVRYRFDGTRLPTLGSELKELTVPNLSDAVLRWGQDAVARYQNLFNLQPTVDDLVKTSDGIAIVVRHWSDGKVWWDLWLPDAQRLRRRIRLGIDDKRVAGGHLHCDSKGDTIACLFGTSTGLDHPDAAHLVLFDMRQVKKTPCN